jgi:hypothetical protein
MKKSSTSRVQQALAVLKASVEDEFALKKPKSTSPQKIRKIKEVKKKPRK